jgi:hypothetical protein
VKNYDKRLENLEWTHNYAFWILVFLARNSGNHSNWDIRRIIRNYPHISLYPLGWDYLAFDITSKEKIEEEKET